MAGAGVKNFDRFIGIDWSGAKSPVFNKAIAVARCDKNGAATEVLGERWSRQGVADFLASLIQEGSRTLVGIDCNFGYAESVLKKQCGKNCEGPDLWRAVDQACAGTDNYFAGPYWENNKDIFWTSGKMPSGFAMPRRVTEQVCGESGYGWPESPFKLIGAKQVGKGGLAGMRMAYDLKKRYGDAIAFWPFEPDLHDRARVVITEIYPRQFLKRAGHGHTKVRTLQDLNRALALFKSPPVRLNDFSDHTADAIMSAAGLRWLCGSGKNIPSSLSHPPCDPVTLKREGWIFGAGDVI